MKAADKARENRLRRACERRELRLERPTAVHRCVVIGTRCRFAAGSYPLGSAGDRQLAADQDRRIDRPAGAEIALRIGQLQALLEHVGAQISLLDGVAYLVPERQFADLARGFCTFSGEVGER